jgi:hypothetical protein
LVFGSSGGMTVALATLSSDSRLTLSGVGVDARW